MNDLLRRLRTGFRIRDKGANQEPIKVLSWYQLFLEARKQGKEFKPKREGT